MPTASPQHVPRGASRFGIARSRGASRGASRFGIGFGILAALLLTPTRDAVGEPLTLRVNDTLGQPGGVVAVVVRTYAPRPVSQGQICFRARPQQGTEAGVTPFTALDEVLVLSELDDAQTQGLLAAQGGHQVVMLEFSSPSAGINRSDGPLAVFYLRLAPDLPPGTHLVLDLDPAASALFDAAGQPIPLEPRAGLLTVRPAGAPPVLAADGDRIPAGRWADLSADTFEPFPLGAGQVVLRYDPAVAAAPPLVTMDSQRYPLAFTVDRDTPGLVRVTFQSLDGRLNTIPGPLVRVRLLTAWNQPAGSSALQLDPQLTFLLDPQGALLPLELVAGDLELEPTTLLFAGGFEGGSTSGWIVGP